MDISYIYNTRKSGPEKPKKSGKKTPGHLIILLVGVGVVLAGLITLIVLFNTTGTENIVPANPKKDCAEVLNRSQDGQLVVSICVKKNGALILLWENLSAEIKSINIFRNQNGGGAPVLWKTVNVSSPNGSADLGEETAASSFSYHFEATNQAGSVTWSSSNPGVQTTGTTVTTSTTTLPGNQTPTGQTGNTNPPPGPTQTPPPPSSTPPPNSTGTTPGPGNNPGGNSTSAPPGEVPGQIYYYSPSGQVTGTSTAPTANFWVQHVNQKIEIGWKNLASSTTKLVVLRSLQESAGYETLLTQISPNTAGDFIRLDDNTINTPYYYKMKVYAGSSLTDTYGPILLSALGQ